MSGALLSFQTAWPYGCPLLLVRHGERGPLDSALGGSDVPLTPNGHRTANVLGQGLAALSRQPRESSELDAPAGRAFVLHHSPLRRCKQTAVAIAHGIRATGLEACVMGPLDGLAGPYLYKPAEALELSFQMGAEFVRAWFDRRLDPVLIGGRAETARSQIGAVLRAQQSEPSSPGVFVSHDWNIMAVREEIFGLRHEDAGWLGFLDGVALVPLGRELVVVYHEEVRRVPLAQALDRALPA